MPSQGALTLFFRWRKKSVQKKASGTATPEAARPASRRGLRPAVAPSGLSSSSVRFAHPPGKRLLLPILAAGLAMSRAAELASLRMQSCALGARLFPPSKWAGLFPSAAYRRSSPPQSAAGRLTPCGGNDFCGLAALPRKEQSLLLPRSWRWAYLPLAGILLPSQWVWCSLPLAGGMGFCCLADFGRLAASGCGGASHEACRRMAVCTR